MIINTSTQPNPKQGNIIVGLLIGAVVALIPSYYFYTKYTEATKKLKNPNQAAQDEIKSVTAKLAMVMELPKGEQPTIATVTDKAKLKDQPFFDKAENGDKLLLYIKARQAILFRDKTGKIVQVAPINLNQPAATGSATVKPTGAASTTPAPTEVMKK